MKELLKTVGLFMLRLVLMPLGAIGFAVGLGIYAIPLVLHRAFEWMEEAAETYVVGAFGFVFGPLYRTGNLYVNHVTRQWSPHLTRLVDGVPGWYFASQTEFQCQRVLRSDGLPVAGIQPHWLFGAQLVLIRTNDGGRRTPEFYCWPTKRALRAVDRFMSEAVMGATQQPRR